MAVVINGTTGVTTPTESVATTIGVGGATPSASGAGITFPATVSLSTNANTLDDYEEGAFTPVPIGTTTAGTFTPGSSNYGTYTKIGNRVIFTMNCTGSLSGAVGSYTFISGLPFLVTSANSNYAGSAVAPMTLTSSLGDKQLQWWSEGGTLYLVIGYSNGTSNSGLDPATYCNGTIRFSIQGSYLTSA